jgi:predicted amidophosphoribosyltransferase
MAISLKDEERSERTVICSGCGKSMPSSLQYCSNCGKKLPAPAQTKEEEIPSERPRGEED